MRGALAAIALAALTVAGAAAEEPPDSATGAAGSDPERPRLCLVLSGGGARGAAHVGVLKVLEELRVPVDCITGTSMGSIVGALYASGVSPAAMDGAFRNTDWVDAFNDSPPRKQVSFRRKEDDLLPLFDFELGLDRRGFHAPRGLIAGQKLSFLLRGLMLHTVTIEHFDELPIPFRAIAADLDDGSRVVIDRGSLAEAVRASMAVPGVFTPVEWEGRLLVDGGIVENLPVAAAREMGAQRLIAVDIGTPRRSLREDETAVGVIRQTFSVLNKRNVAESRASLTADDVLVTPDLESVSASSFGEVGQAIDLGEAAAREVLAELSRYSVSEDQYRRFLERQRSGLDASLPDLVIGEVEITGSKRVDPRQIRRRLRTRPGTRIDLDLLRDDLERLYQIGEFEQVDFRISRRTEDDYRLTIVTRDKEWGPGYFRAGLTLSSDLKGESEFLALASYRRTQLNALGGEWRTVVTVGDVSSLHSEFYQPLDYRGFWAVTPRVEWNRDEFLDPSGEAGGIAVEEYALGVDIGVQLKNYAEITLGAETGRLSADSQNAGGFDEDQGGFRLQAILDQVDDTDFPRRGSLATVDLFRSSSALGAETDFDRLEVTWFGAKSWGRNTWLANLRYGTALDTVLPVSEQFELGGFGNLSGLQPRELRGDAAAFGSLLYYRQIGKFYLGGAVEAGNTWLSDDDLDLNDVIGSGLVFVGRKTFLGPLYLGYGVAEDSRDSVYLFVGQLF